MQKYHDDEKTEWSQARKVCQEEHGSDLVIVDNDQENDYLYTFAKENEIHVWIGIQEKVTGTNENNETTYDFFWIDGQLVNSEAETSFSKWAEGGNQPEYGKIFSSHRKIFYILLAGA